MSAPDKLAEIAGRLGDEGCRFLGEVCAGVRLGFADRAEDRIRQKTRREGVVFYGGSPNRWRPTDLGLAVRAHLLSAGAA